MARSRGDDVAAESDTTRTDSIDLTCHEVLPDEVDEREETEFDREFRREKERVGRIPVADELLFRRSLSSSMINNVDDLEPLSDPETQRPGSLPILPAEGTLHSAALPLHPLPGQAPPVTAFVLCQGQQANVAGMPVHTAMVPIAAPGQVSYGHPAPSLMRPLLRSPFAPIMPLPSSHGVSVAATRHMVPTPVFCHAGTVVQVQQPRPVSASIVPHGLAFSPVSAAPQQFVHHPAMKDSTGGQQQQQ